MYEFEDFQDPIEAACLSALDRLHSLRLGNYDDISESDVVLERIVSREQDAIGEIKIQTRLDLFSTAFSPIHTDVMEMPDVPEYFNDVISGLVRTGIQHREEWAGNIVTQLIPDNEALRNHVCSVWQMHAEERQSRTAFSVYRFNFRGDIAEIKFVYDTNSDCWKIGYGTNLNRVILHWGKYLYEEADGMLVADPINEDTDELEQ